MVNVNNFTTSSHFFSLAEVFSVLVVIFNASEWNLKKLKSQFSSSILVFSFHNSLSAIEPNQ